MPLATNYHATSLFEGDGVTEVWEFVFAGAKPLSDELPYLNTSDIKAYTFPDAPEVVLTPVAFTWLTPSTIRITPAVAAGTRLMIRRETASNYNLTDYRNFGEGFTEYDLEQSQRQLLMLVQEAADHAAFTRGTGDVVVISPVGVNSLVYNPEDGILTLTTADGSELQTPITPSVGGSGFVGITAIVPQDLDENVVVMYRAADPNIVQSIVSSTHDFTVTVRATTGTATWKPQVTVEGVSVALSRLTDTDVWEGSANITAAGNTITIINDGTSDVVEVTYDDPIAVATATFAATPYLNAPAQTEVAAGQQLQVLVTANPAGPQFTGARLIMDGGATVDQTFSFAATHSKTLITTAADHGDSPNTKPIKVQLKTAAGTWGPVFTSTSLGSTDGVHTVVLNDTRPVVTVTSITYPPSQQALKGSEQATLVVSITPGCSLSVEILGSDLDLITAGATTEVQRIAGDYVVGTPNVQFTGYRPANAGTTVVTAAVSIANAVPTVTVSIPNSSRVRSSVAGLAHTVTISNSGGYRMLAPTLSASSGTLGSFTTADNGVTYTATLIVNDADSRGTQSFLALSVATLAGVVVTAIAAGAEYTVAGFTARTVSIAAFPNRLAYIGVPVTDLTKLIVSHSLSGALIVEPTTVDADGGVCVTDAGGAATPTGAYLYHTDLALSVANSLGLSTFTVEESI